MRSIAVPARRSPTGELVVLGARLLFVTALGIGIGALVTGPLAGSVGRDLDRPAVSFALSHPNAFWDRALQRIQQLGTVWGAAALAVVLGGAFALATRSVRPLVQCVTAALGAALITVAVREVVTRPAQDGPAKGFPSGHALLAVAVYGTAAVLALRSIERQWQRWIVALALTFVAGAVAWARVYRLDHVASDVIGSVVIGSAWVYAIARLGD